jgi:predicted DNA-binding protein
MAKSHHVTQNHLNPRNTTLRWPDELRARVQAEAARREQTMSAFIRSVMKRELEQSAKETHVSGT